MFVGKFSKGEFFIGRYVGIERHKDLFFCWQILQSIHPIGDGQEGVLIGAIGEIIPTRPYNFSFWHKLFIAMQICLVS